MIDQIIGLMRKTLIDDSTTNALVGTRIYPTHLAVRNLSNKLSEDDFPCITIHYSRSDKAGTYPRDGWYIFLIQSWSNTVQSICYQIHDAIIGAFFGEHLADANYRIQVGEETDQGILSEKTEAGIRHWHSCNWKVWATKRT